MKRPHRILRGAIGLLLLAWLTLGLVGLAGPLAAQEAADGTAIEAPDESGAIDYAEWEAEATRAENLIEAGRASTAFLENLREALAEWRARFLAAETTNDSRLETVQAQLDALGPVPEEGVAEANAIAERRAQLSERLSELQVPGREAAAAFNRADGLIEEIDALLRARQQEELLRLDPSPANPANWPDALDAFGTIASAIRQDLRQRLDDPVRRANAVDNAPAIVLMLLVGALALSRGPRWIGGLGRRVRRGRSLRGQAAMDFLGSLLQAGVMVGGLVLILAAVEISGYAAQEVMDLLMSLGTLALVTILAVWLAARLFPEEGDLPLGILDLGPAERAQARRVVTWIGVAVGVTLVVHTITDLREVSPAAKGVLQLPVHLWLAILFWQAGRLLRRTPKGAAAEDSDPSTFMRGSFSLLARVLMAVGLVGPILALVGYVNAAEALMVPTALTLGVLGVLVAVQPVIRDLYALIIRSTEAEARDALLPVLVNFALIFAALPVLALIWGMRPDQLAEIYARFWEGVPIGTARITPGNILAVILVFTIGYLITRLLQGALKSTVLPRTRLDTGARNALTSGIGYVGIGIAALVAITAGGIDLTALGFVLGALSVGIGFGLQNVVNNFVSGIILLIERPISEGDWIEVGGNMGIVKSISVRSTRIETFDRTDVIVPNADFISGTVTNWTRGNTIGRIIVNVGVAYGTDTRRVEAILREIVNDTPGVAQFPEPGVDFMGFGADSLDFRIRVILDDISTMVAMKTELHHRIAERFAEEGIEIPFAQRDIWLRNPETLQQARQGAGAPRNGDPET